MAGLKDLIQKCLPGAGSETFQFLILGPSGAGKTTLLYRLKVGQDWKTMKDDLAEMRKKKKKKKNTVMPLRSERSVAILAQGQEVAY
mmetsp:Transcript_2034/g.1610  ORF Transcript_2034/g.1610 Transcript_2034/m.1610 type:complete len:87 (+) Transcript_2034:176-436(+)